MQSFLIFYLIVGVLDYFRVQEEYRKKLQEDFPYHDPIYIELSLWAVCILFSLPLHIIKIYMKVKQFLVNLWKKITFPFRLRKFSKKMDEVGKEEDADKAVKMMFDAMREILK